LLTDLASLESCAALMTHDTTLRAGHLQQALEDLRQAQARAADEQRDPIHALQKDISILQKLDCSKDLQGCITLAERDPALGVEIGLLTTLEECTDPQQQLSNLDATYPYYSHASLALSYIFALRTASDLQQLDPSLNSTFLSLQRQVQVAALRLKQDQANKALLTEELRNEDDFQKRLKQVSSTVQGEIAVRMACDPLVPGEHAEERQQMLTRAQRILAVSNDDPATGLTAEDLSAEAAAIMPRADPAKLKKLRRFTEEALSRHPDIPRLRYALALVEMRQGDVEHAISNLKIVTSLDSDNPEAHFALGYAYFQAGNGDAGTEEWGYARVLDPARWQLRTENPVYTCALKTAPVYAQSRAASRDAGTRKHLP
jgi:hypothetical protein